MELLKLLTALRRRKWLMIFSIVVVTALAVVAALLLPKNYQAAAKVLVSSSDSSMSILSDLGLSEVATSLSSSDEAISNTVALATTRPLLEDVIWRLQLRDSDGRLYTYEEVLVAGLTGELEARPNLSVTQQQGADILIFQATADDPVLAQLIADTAVQLAVRRAQERAREDTRGARMFVEKQLVVVQEEFDRAMQEMSKAQVDEGILDIETEMKAAISRMSELMMAYEENAAAIQETRGKIAEQQAYQGRETAEQVSPATVGVNSKIQQLQTELVNLRQQRAEQRLQKTEKHPDIVQLDKMIASTQGELERALAEQHAMDPTVQQLQAQLAGLAERSAEIQAAIDRTTGQFGAFPEKMRKISQLRLTAEAAEAVFQSLQEQRYEIGVAEAMAVSDLLPIEAAVAPDRHSSPKVLVNLIIGLALGMMLGASLVFLFEYIDDTIKSPEDLTAAWDAPRLGVIPRFKAPGDKRTLDVLPTTHPVAESYRTVRNGLLYASLDKPLRIVGVTSSLPGEGKSTFSINLAISFAREGKRVLVVDCDLRKPAQHRHFPSTSNHQGLIDILTGKLEVAEAIQETPVPGLYLLSSGPTPTDPARLIESLRLRQILLDLQKGYDLVIVDTPPGLVVNDSIVIARVVDGMIVVIEAEKTTKRQIEDLRDRFAAGAIEPLGLVLNKLDFNTSGLGYYYRAYQQYHPDSMKPNKPSKKTSGGAA